MTARTIDIAKHYHEDVLRQLAKLRQLAERALEQTPDDGFFAPLGPDENSIAVMVKHVAGNMRSRWTDFLTTDGDKPWRDRDAEFELSERDTRAALTDRWREAWNLTEQTIAALGPDDLMRIVRIRGEAHTVVEAIDRQLSHYAYHVGQIVLLARHQAGESWQSLSIPKGRSRDYDVAKDGKSYQPTRSVP